MKQDETLALLTAGLTADRLRQLATTLAHPADAIRPALEQLTAVVVSTLQVRVARPNGPEVIWTLARQAQANDALNVLLGLPADQWPHAGRHLLQGLLGEQYEPTLQRLTTDLPTPQVVLLLEVAVANVLTALSTHAAAHQLDSAALARWLQERPRPVAPGRPAPLPRPTAPEAGPRLPPSPPEAAPNLSQRITVAGAGTWERIGGGITFTPEKEAPAATWRPWQWALGAVVVLLLSFWLGRRFLRPDVASVPPTAATVATLPAPAAEAATAPGTLGHYDPATDTYIYDTGQPVQLTLPDGSTQRVGKNSTEYQLYRFLIDPARRVDTLNPLKNWINLDRTYFESGQATLTGESEQQLRHLASILQAFPRAQVRFGGYSDSTGDDLQNLVLSEARAVTAMRKLRELGVARERLQAQGYGASFFVASNVAPVGRALNRRLSLQVVSKDGPLWEPETPPAPTGDLPPGKPARIANAPTRRANARRRPQPKPKKTSKVGRWFKQLGQQLRSK